MRDIKFRVWHKEYKSMFNVRKLHFLGSRIKVNNDIDFVLNMNDKENQNIILMQYTGIKDKNGKEIYEGDIFKNCEGLIKLVVWKDNGFKAKYTFKRRYQGEEWNEHSFTDLRDTESKRWGVEIIGNIYENKDLLEK